MLDQQHTNIILGAPGCVSGEAKICVNRFGKAFSTTLADLYSYGLNPRKKVNSIRKICTRSLSEAGIFHLNEIIAIHKSGKRKTIEICTESEKSLVLTPDHKVLTPDGFYEAISLRIGSEILTEGGKIIRIDQPKFCSKCGKQIHLKLRPEATYFGWCYNCIVSKLRELQPMAAIDKNGYILIYVPSHPRSHRSRVLEHIVVMEAKLNRFLSQNERVHHLDKNPMNNDPKNLILTSMTDHSKHHSWVRNLVQGVFIPAISKITSIANFGLCETYDIEVASPDHNFIANGIVVHNCGKTTKLLSMVEEALVSGVPPNKIGFVSFTKKAAEEGRLRASAKFNLPEEDFPHFRTLHSMAFKYLGMRRDQVLNWHHIKELGKVLGMDFKGRGEVAEDDIYGMNVADRMLFFEGLARNTKRPLKNVWNEALEDAIDWFELERFASALTSFKKVRMLWDFTDMIERFCLSDISTFPTFDLLIVDEIQDTSPLQWDMIKLLANNAKQICVGGDDCQGIYRWSGADVDQFITLPGKQLTLEQSYRIPGSVHKLALQLEARISNKRPRFWTAKNEPGAINWYNSIDEVDLSKGTWLLLARNGYMLTELEDYCLQQGFSFHSVNRDPLKSYALAAIRTWESLRRGQDESTERILDCFRYMGPTLVTGELLKKLKADDPGRMRRLPELRELGLKTDKIWHECLTKISPKERDFFIAARRRGEALLKEPRIKISTIHASKGTEADNVLLLTDMSYRCFNNMQLNYDDECRVFYVATTRCRQTLNLITPKTNLSFDL